MTLDINRHIAWMRARQGENWTADALKQIQDQHNQLVATVAALSASPPTTTTTTTAAATIATPSGVQSIKGGNLISVTGSADTPTVAAQIGGVNLQTGAYTIVGADNTRLVVFNSATAIVATLTSAATLGTLFYCAIENIGTGALTVTPASGTLDGLTSLVVEQNQGITVYSDGTNFYTERGIDRLASSQNLFKYRCDTSSTSPPPTDGDIIWNNATQTSATNLYFSNTTDDNLDVNLFLGLIASGGSLIIQESADSTNYQKWTVSGAPASGSGYWTIPVTFVSSGGSGTTNFSNNQRLIAAYFAPSSGGSGAMTLIQKTTIAVATNSVTFSSIPGTYNHLYLVVNARMDDSATTAEVRVQLNGDTGSNYAYQQWQTNNNSGYVSQAFIKIGSGAAATDPANLSGVLECLLPDYAGTTFYKSTLSRFQGFSSLTNTTQLFFGAHAGVWQNTSAVTSMTVYDGTGGNFIVGSTFCLYGIT